MRKSYAAKAFSYPQPVINGAGRLHGMHGQELRPGDGPFGG